MSQVEKPNTHTDMTYGTYILIGRTNPYLAQRNGWRSTTIAMRAEYCQRGLVEGLMKHYCLNECDNHTLDDNGNVVDGNEVILAKDGLIYEHDSKVYEFVKLEDLNEQEAKATLRDNVLFDDAAKQTIYDRFPDFAPVVEADEE
jgi:hypothetical protein